MRREQTMAWTMTLILSTVLGVGIASAQKRAIASPWKRMPTKLVGIAL